MARLRESRSCAAIAWKTCPPTSRSASSSTSSGTSRDDRRTGGSVCWRLCNSWWMRCRSSSRRSMTCCTSSVRTCISCTVGALGRPCLSPPGTACARAACSFSSTTKSKRTSEPKRHTRSCERINCPMQIIRCNAYRYTSASTRSGTRTSCISGSSISASTSSSTAAAFTLNMCASALASSQTSSMGRGSRETRSACPRRLTCRCSSEVRSSMSCRSITEQFTSSCLCMPAITTGTCSCSLCSIRSTRASTCSTPIAERT
mmetsp:Transcript_40889/g.123444  ORF Transcript_40889/g.123444 Transcript_40889/m.123444 type:complete len:260 (-) Transcript_40889:242-1021(-)